MPTTAESSLVTIEEGSGVLARLGAERAEGKLLARDAEHYILHFDAELAAYRREKEVYLQKAIDVNSGIRGGPGRPTESKAMLSIRFDEEYPALRWLKAVEILRRALGERKNIFIRVRVEAARTKGRVVSLKGRPGWVGYVQRRYAEELGKRFLTEEVYGDRAIRACWQDILAKAVAIYKKIP